MSLLKWKLITLNEEFFLNIGGLSSSGSPLGDYENEQWESFDAFEMYKSCLRGPHYFVLGELSKVRSLTVENRLLHYLIAYILIQRNTNHTQPTVNDLKLMFAIREDILVNWPAEISKVMFGIVSLSSQLLTYGIFISRVIDHLKVDTSDVEFKLTNTREHLVGEHLIQKMNIYWYIGQWMYQEDCRTMVDVDLSHEEHNADLPKQNPDPRQAEASQVP
ncbi:hypothetical protein Lal_00030143 [Lupinus albus]|nr:hypothetical protein Lal_00030143 [Lupinus albus]